MALQVYQWYEIIFLSQHPLGPKVSHTAVAKAVHCDVKTVKRWLKRWKQSKDLTDAPRSGRPSKLNFNEIRSSYKQTASQRIPRTTVQRAAKKMGLRRVKRRRSPVLSEANKMK